MVAGSCTTHSETHFAVMAGNAGPVELWGSIHGSEETPFVKQALFWYSILPLRRHSSQTTIIQKLLCSNFSPPAAAALKLLGLWVTLFHDVMLLLQEVHVWQHVLIIPAEKTTKGIIWDISDKKILRRCRYKIPKGTRHDIELNGREPQS
jgi:hypothetical protein